VIQNLLLGLPFSSTSALGYQTNINLSSSSSTSHC